MVTRTRKFDHITPALEKLHWLPVAFRIKYKVLVMVFKALDGTGPSYISGLLQYYKCGRSGLRSENKFKLDEPRTKRITFGDRAFSHSGPKLWNELPIDIRMARTLETFKKITKDTFL